MTDTDNREELKEIAEYVREQRLETDLANVQGYGIDQGARSVRFSLASVAAVENNVAALKNSVRANTEKIGTHTQQILDLGNSISGLGELPERNRRDIDTLGDAMREYGERLTRDEGSIRTNAGTIESVSREVSRVSNGLNDAVERLDDAEQDITDLGRRIAQCQKMVYDLDGYVAYEGEVVQYGGEGGKYDHGGFYEWNDTEWVRLSVDDHTALEQKVKANTDAITILDGDEQTSGSVRNTVLDYIGKAQHARFKVVQTLPPVSEAESNVMYLVPFPGKEGVYKQYILADGRFVQLDNTEVDLSDYYTKHETDTAISDVADALTAKDTEQDGRLTNLEKHKQVNSDWNATSGVAQILNKPTLAAVATSGSYEDLTDKPTISTDYVPYHASLDDVPISEREGKIYQNWGTSYRHGGFYEWLQIIIKAGTTYVELSNNTLGCPDGTYYEDTESKLVRCICYRKEKGNDVLFDAYGLEIDDMDNGFLVDTYEGMQTISNLDKSAGTFDIVFNGVTYHYKRSYVYEYDEKHLYKRIDGGVEITQLTSNSGVFWDGSKYTYHTGLWHNEFYDKKKKTTTDMPIGEPHWELVYVQPTSESEIKTDLSALTSRVGTAETAINNINAKWTEILFSQIDADHQTLGTLSGYLTSAKRTSIDNAISLAHQQNTDTQLKDGKLKVESNRISATLPIVSSGDIQGTDTTTNTTHLLSKKLNSDMLRMYSSWSAMESDKANIPDGAWCAIINTHSAGVSAQSDDDYLL